MLILRKRRIITEEKKHLKIIDGWSRKINPRKKWNFQYEQGHELKGAIS
jgi:hypothetical protein